MTEANIEDFLNPETEAVTLPSGLRCVLLPPTRLEFFARLGLLPSRMAQAAAGETPEPLRGQALADQSYEFIAMLFVEPKFSTKPGPGEIHPRRLKEEDRKWLDDWAEKYLSFGGLRAQLESFRTQPAGPAAGAGSGGGDVSLPAEPTSPGEPEGLGD